MLRITVVDEPNVLAVRLEGKLAGDWVQEAERVWRNIQPSLGTRTLVVDLCDVLALDAEGRALLGSMHAAGAQLKASGPVLCSLVRDIAKCRKPYSGTALKLLGSLLVAAVLLPLSFPSCRPASPQDRTFQRDELLLTVDRGQNAATARAHRFSAWLRNLYPEN